MMRCVLRYELQPSLDPVQIPLGYNAQVLSVGIKPGDGCVSMWALVPQLTTGKLPGWLRTFYCVGTGPAWQLPSENVAKLQHIGTVIEPNSGTVWHVFEVLT